MVDTIVEENIAVPGIARNENDVFINKPSLLCSCK